MTSIIIPCRFRADLTEVCLDTIQLYTKDYEIIAVQEGEDSELKTLLSKYLLKYIQHKKPLGYSASLNAGLKEAEGDYYCFMNNDVAVTPGWLSEMLKGFEDKEVGLVAPTFSSLGLKQSVDWNSDRDFDVIIDDFVLCGVCFLIKKEVIDKVGKWDEDFFWGGEDHDLTYRISRAGYKLLIARKSFIYHYGGASGKEFLDTMEDSLKIAEDNFRKLEKKHNIKILK